MGICLNRGAHRFLQARNSEIYVDKTGLIAYTNRVLNTEQKAICVSRPRRFGKSIAAGMLAAYYDRTVDARQVFHGLGICRDPGFAAHCSQFDVIFLNMQDYLSEAKSMDGMLALLEDDLRQDFREEYPRMRQRSLPSLRRMMLETFRETGRQFVIVIDEWDCIFRECRENTQAQEQYLDFLRNWLKDKDYIALAYLTGILPIKKYGTHSALNMFDEFSMADARMLAPYTGFLADEVKSLCAKYNMSFAEARQWYDGYVFPECGEIYNPRSVVASMLSGRFSDYWNQTETFEALKVYIDMDFQKDKQHHGIIEECIVEGGCLRWH